MPEAISKETVGRLAIIAGRGSLPREIASGLKNAGNAPFLIGIENESEPWISGFEHQILGWGQFGKLFSLLNEMKIEQIMLAGSVTRPKVSISKMDWGAIRSLPQILAFMLGGDNSLLTGVIHLFEKRGIKVVGAHEVMPGLLAGKGAIAGRKPSRKSMANLKKAFEACKLLGQLDIGQAAVAVGGRVVAVEGIEGTDEMVLRVENLRSSGKLYEDGREGVLVKTMKPNQDMRVDLPAIGPETVKGVAAAGLRGIAVEAGRSLVLSKQETLSAARELDIFIFGHTPEDTEPAR